MRPGNRQTDGAENRRSFLPGLRALKARKNLFFYCESRLEVFLRPGRSPWRADKKRVRRRSAQACAGFGLKALPHNKFQYFSTGCSEKAGQSAACSTQPEYFRILQSQQNSDKTLMS